MQQIKLLNTLQQQRRCLSWIAKVEELPSGNEAIGLLWAALRRLQEPDVSKDEAKKLRLIIQGAKSYIHLENLGDSSARLPR